MGLNLHRPLGRVLATVAYRLERTLAWYELMMREGRQLCFLSRRLDTLESLADAEFKVFSQFGEDGIIEWLVQRAVGIPEQFVEFGVGDYRESNTHFLLRNRNWRGLILDSSAACSEFLEQANLGWQYTIIAAQAFITRDNINALLEQNGFRGEIGILSIDIDGNDYWVLEAINVIRPWIIICEYNSLWGDLIPLSMPYDSQQRIRSRHYSRRYYGASIKAIEHLASTRSYTLIGSNLAGNNAFFVRNDIFDRMNLSSRITSRRARPSLFRHVYNRDGSRSSLSGRQRSTVLADCVAQNVVTGDSGPLKEFGNIYSEHWTSILG